jgi:hypothetical protein
LFYARDNTSTPEAFLKNILNNLGNSCGVDMIEMSLLAFSLGIVIEDYRIGSYGEDGYKTVFPLDGTHFRCVGSNVPAADPSVPAVAILSEDDRHYNAPCIA